MGDFNSQPTEEAMKSFCQMHNFNNLLDKPTGYKTPTSPSFKALATFETGLSRFHKMTLTVLKASFAKLKLRLLNYRNYKFFNNTLFRDQILSKLSESKL